MSLSTSEFKKNISEILEYDYGDFMRAANVYLNHLRSELSVLGDPEIDKKIDAMQVYLQFAPNWDVEPTRMQLIQDTLYIEDILRGHEQDWESDSQSLNSPHQP